MWHDVTWQWHISCANREKQENPVSCRVTRVSSQLVTGIQERFWTKLSETIDSAFSNKVTGNERREIFKKVISSCPIHKPQELYCGCWVLVSSLWERLWYNYALKRNSIYKKIRTFLANKDQTVGNTSAWKSRQLSSHIIEAYKIVGMVCKGSL